MFECSAQKSLIQAPTVLISAQRRNGRKGSLEVKSLCSSSSQLTGVALANKQNQSSSMQLLLLRAKWVGVLLMSINIKTMQLSFQ